jgi:hypothetical protein
MARLDKHSARSDGTRRPALQFDNHSTLLLRALLTNGKREVRFERMAADRML